MCVDAACLLNHCLTVEIMSKIITFLPKIMLMIYLAVFAVCAYKPGKEVKQILGYKIPGDTIDISAHG